MQFVTRSPHLPEEAGFINEVGGHLSRTIMVEEISTLLNTTEPDASSDALRVKVIEDNILRKASISGRKKTFLHLKKMYGLDPELALYRAFRWAWHLTEEKERPTLALLYALCRDAALRTSVSYILSLPYGAIAEVPALSAVLEQAYPNRYSPAMLKSLTQNVLSSWTQSGHLSGKRNKRRTKPSLGTMSVAFALFIGSLTGLQGRTLFHSVWVQALDATDLELQDAARRASRKGWIQYREGGGMMEITFSPEILARTS